MVIDRSKKKGFYLITALCVVAAGAGVWGAMLTSRSPELPTEPERSTIDWNNEGGRTLTDPQVNLPATDVPDERPAQTEPSTEDRGNTPYTGEFALPMGTDILKDYSQGEMVKSNTMGDWRVHNGIDFRAALDTEVVAMQSGSVKRVYKDALWGTVVEIDHGKGLTARYCGLLQDSTVQQGKEIKQYDRVGKLGTIPLESTDGPHLHLEIQINGKLVDPLAAMNKAGE